MAHLNLPVRQEGYSVDLADPAMQEALRGGLSRKRLDLVDETAQVNVEWRLSRTQYDQFMAFYRSVASKGTAFTVNLVVGDASLQAHTCRMVPGSLTQKEHTTHFTIGATLEVELLSYSAASDTALMDIYDAYPEDGEAARVFLSFEELVEEHLVSE